MRLQTNKRCLSHFQAQRGKVRKKVGRKQRKRQREEYKDGESGEKDNLYLHANDGIDEKQHGN